MTGPATRSPLDHPIPSGHVRHRRLVSRAERLALFRHHQLSSLSSPRGPLMTKDRLFPLPAANRLLSRLPEYEYQRLLPALQPVVLELERTLYDGHGPLEVA